MMKKIIGLAVMLCCVTMADLTGVNFWQTNSCQATMQAKNNGSYSATSRSVNVYTESGHPKGSFTVYLHKGKKYINFQNSWICIEGKSRFAHNGNWYVIK